MTWNKPKDKTMVVNFKRDRLRYFIYIGRDGRDPKGRGKWGNPFAIKKGVRTREQSIAQYILYFYHPDQAGLRALARKELKGEILGCYCKPDDCHGDVIATYLNNGEEK